MEESLIKFAKGKIDFPDGQDRGKIMSVSQAVKRFVKPGMCIQTGCGMAFPTATYYEVVRQFWGRDPGFTLAALGGGATSYAVMVQGGMCRKIISSYNGDGYPFPIPNPILVKAYQDKTVEFEDWTMLSLLLRFMAGAMGVPFFPTKSILGSSIEKDQSERFRRVKSPFGDGEEVGLVEALNPDISLVHGWAADPEGNTLISPPFTSNAYGPLAAKSGVIVSVEKIVDPDYVRKFSHMARIPGHIVKAVCEEPMGAHPGGHPNQGLPDFEGYGEDQEFIFEAREACRDTGKFQAWIDKWILDCRDHRDYLAKLGHRRIWYLKGRIQRDTWESEMADLGENIDSLPAEEAAIPERLIVAGSKKLKAVIQGKGYRTILCGVGTPNLASWLAYYELRQQGYPIELMAELGFYGYSPRPSDPWVFNLRNIPTCRMTTDIFHVLGIHLCGSQASSLGVLGAAQVDRHGNINSSRIPETNGYLVGSGGGNDTASGAGEVVVMLEQNRHRFVDRVGFITSPGRRVTTIISQYGVYEKPIGEEELVLTAYYLQEAGQSPAAALEVIKAQTGWDLKVHPEARIIEPPTAEELRFLRSFDLRGFYTAGQREARRNPFAK
ncbi:MAG: hypothetical protein KKB20_23210 [Proteobacteria bacterium]|nr:hypothetical protein [Pseudomonadota bacterium]